MFSNTNAPSPETNTSEFEKHSCRTYLKTLMSKNLEMNCLDNDLKLETLLDSVHGGLV